MKTTRIVEGTKGHLRKEIEKTHQKPSCCFYCMARDKSVVQRVTDDGKVSKRGRHFRYWCRKHKMHTFAGYLCRTAPLFWEECKTCKGMKTVGALCDDGYDCLSTTTITCRTCDGKGYTEIV